MIRLEIPWLPPSSNHAYSSNGFGGRTLSMAGKKFKHETLSHLAQHYPQQLRIFRPNKPYFLVIRFFFKEIETAGFARGKAKNRYKVFDGGNRTKLLEDVLKDAGGIDDSQTMTSIWQKVHAGPISEIWQKAHAGPISERTLIWAWSLEEESTPFDDALRHLG